MRVLAVVIAACAMARTAIAQRSSAAARSAASAGLGTPKSPDSFGAEEDERVNAQLRNICRGCWVHRAAAQN